MRCPGCSKEINDNAKFCKYCGKKIENNNPIFENSEEIPVEKPLFITCPNCGKEMQADKAFCTNCGNPLNGVVIKEDASDKEKPSAPKRKSFKVILCLVALLIIGGAVTAATYFLKFNDNKSDKAVEKTDEGGREDDEDVKRVSDGEEKDSSAEQMESETESKTDAEAGILKSNDSESDNVVENTDKAFSERSAIDEDETEEDTSNLTETFGQTVPGTGQTSASVEPDAAEAISTEPDSSASEEKTEASPVSMDAISSVSATSYLTESEYGLVHHPSNVVDGSLSNAWVEDAAGQGEGESITIQLDETYKLSGFNINAGYQKSADTFDKNSRPATLLITFSDGSSMDITLNDVNEQQQVTFPSAIETSSVTFTIESVYPGSEYEDTVISEIQLF